MCTSANRFLLIEFCVHNIVLSCILMNIHDVQLHALFSFIRPWLYGVIIYVGSDVMQACLWPLHMSCLYTM